MPGCIAPMYIGQETREKWAISTVYPCDNKAVNPEGEGMERHEQGFHSPDGRGVVMEANDGVVGVGL